MSPTSTLHGELTELEASSSVRDPRSDHFVHPPHVTFDLSRSKPSQYPGRGTEDDPYVVDWDLADVQNPFNWNKFHKWIITAQLGLSTFTVSFGSSSYTGGISFIMKDLNVSQEVALLGVTLYVIGFGSGPLLFAPLSEIYGRRIVFLCTYFLYMLFHLGGALGQNIATILVTRLLAGLFGSCPLTNAGGVIADIWIPRERGMAASLYSSAPFFGPLIGPIVGGYISVIPKLGWRFTFWILVIMSGLIVISSFLLVPESFGPVLLRRRAHALSKESGGQLYYVSKHDLKRSTSLSDVLRVNLSRPFVFMFTEPIVICAALYVSLAYAILYSFLSAYPIIFQEHRGFSPGEGGLAFLGVGVGVIIGLCIVPLQTRYYWKAMDTSDTGKAPPEARLYTAMFTSICLPISLFWLAWTAEPPVHYMVPILSGVPFGCAVSQIMQGISQYLMDAYSIHCASALAATVVLRSLFGAVFPLFSPAMFKALGDQWAVSVFGFIALVGTPLPVLFFKYGRWMRHRSKFAFKEDGLELASSATSATITVNEKEPVEC